MQVKHLEVALFFGFFLLQISSISASSAASDCLDTMRTCMSDLCRHEQALHAGKCEDEGCLIKGLEVCNMTIQTALDQFSSLRGCVCGWEGEQCDSIQLLASQCAQTAAVQQKKSTMLPSSHGIEGNDDSRSCMERISLCISDSVCNTHLAPLLQACMTEQCVPGRCKQETQRFYGNMPQSNAEMLVMCECEASDESCLLMRTALQSGACGDETKFCQERLDQCTEDSNCRDLFKTLRTECWIPEVLQCSETNPPKDCLMLRHPDLMLGTRSECKRAFLATLGTVLHHPCTCEGLYSHHLFTCRIIQEVFHNRSYFMGENSGIASKPPKIIEPKHAALRLQGDLLHACAAVVSLGVVLIVLFAGARKICVLRKRDQFKRCPHPKKNCAALP